MCVGPFWLPCILEMLGVIENMLLGNLMEKTHKNLQESFCSYHFSCCMGTAILFILIWWLVSLCGSSAKNTINNVNLLHREDIGTAILIVRSICPLNAHSNEMLLDLPCSLLLITLIQIKTFNTSCKTSSMTLAPVILLSKFFILVVFSIVLTTCKGNDTLLHNYLDTLYQICCDYNTLRLFYPPWSMVRLSV